MSTKSRPRDASPVGIRQFARALCYANWASKSFVVVALTLLIVKWLFVLVIFPSSSIVAPDEGAYVQLVAWIVDGQDWREWRGGSGGKFFPAGFTLLGPATLIHAIGVEPLLGLRLVSGFYTLMTLVVVMSIVRKVNGLNGSLVESRIYAWQVFWIAVWLFLPSSALWSSLGLKEAALQFYLSLAVWGVLSLAPQSDGWIGRLSPWLALIVGVFGMSFSRSEMGLLFGFALLFTCVVHFRTLKALALALSLAVLFLSFLGYVLSRPQVALSETAANQESVQSSETVFSSPGEFWEPGLEIYIPPPDNESLRTRLSAFLQWPGERRDALRDGAASQVPRASCEALSGDADVLACEVRRLPVATFWVLASPNPLSGPAPTSALAKVAGFENLAWLLLVAILALTVRLTKVTDQISARLVSTAMWILLPTTLVALALVGGNLGTSFRQKSVLLVVVVLLAVVRVPRGSPGLRES